MPTPMPMTPKVPKVAKTIAVVKKAPAGKTMVGRYAGVADISKVKPSATDKAIAKMPRYQAPAGTKLRKPFPDLPGQMP